MIADGELLLAVLQEPASVLSLDPSGWNDLLDCAHRHGLLARLSATLADAALIERIPATAQDILADARAAAEANRTVQRFEVSRVLRALDGLDVPVVLLKGGAYLMAGLPPSRGRLSGDLDILVPRESLARVEQAVLAHGWQAIVTETYDQQYYRDWSHQIPPLRHGDRETELDIHHTIAPPTGRAKPDTPALLRDARPLGDGRVSVLSPPDMVLHSAVHLFNEHMAMGLRDLLDLHDLLGHFGRHEDFWGQLFRHATRHGMERPLYYCVRFCRRLLGTRIPAQAQAEIDAFAPNPLLGAVMDRIVPAALVHDRPDRPSPIGDLARWLLYVRSHWLRMPPGMLARHLLVKATRRVRRGAEATPAPRP